MQLYGNKAAPTFEFIHTCFRHNNVYTHWLVIYSEFSCRVRTQLPTMQVVDWIISQQLCLYDVVFSHSIYIQLPFCLHKIASLVSLFSVGSVGSVLLLPPVDITSNHVISCWLLPAHVVGCQSFLRSSPFPSGTGDGALSSRRTPLIYGWILPLGRRVKRITEQNEIKENSVRVWPAIMTVSMLNASFAQAIAGKAGNAQWLHWECVMYTLNFTLSKMSLSFVLISSLVIFGLLLRFVLESWIIVNDSLYLGRNIPIDFWCLVFWNTDSGS